MGRKKIKPKKNKYKYACTQCLQVWTAVSNPGVCPACGSAYYKWVNYSDFELRQR